MSTLHEQQRRFALHLFPDAKIQSTFLPLALKQTPSAQFADEQRLQIYRNNVAISLREALVGVYPIVQALVGDVFFQHLAREYVHSHPSCTGNLHEFGNRLADFLKSFPGLEGLPYLPDMAKLEWAAHQVFHTSEQRVLNLSALSMLDEAQSAELRFHMSNACACLKSEYPVLDIWQANQHGNEQVAVSLDSGAVQFVVLRNEHDIEFHSLGEGVFALVQSLSQGDTFVQACGMALRADADCNVDAALQFLVQKKIVVGFSCV